MTQPKRVVVARIVAAYKRTGSVWKAAKELGISGQSVWERLRALGHPMPSAKWSPDEVSELRSLVDAGVSAADISQRLGRPFAGVACKLSELGLYVRKGRKVVAKVPRGSGITKITVAGYIADLAAQPDLSLRHYCRRKGISIDLLAAAIQTHQPRAWDAISRAKGLAAKECPNCSVTFYPMTPKQTTCSRRCTSTLHRDRAYFGGKRKNTIGLADGVCQLCLRDNVKGLSSHHVFGKENDPDNDTLVALCQGCHKLVGVLGSRKFIEDPAALERLIELAIWRKNGERRSSFHGTHVYVEVEYLTAADLSDSQE